MRKAGKVIRFEVSGSDVVVSFARLNVPTSANVETPRFPTRQSNLGRSTSTQDRESGGWKQKWN